MKQIKNLRWAVIAASILSGPALAADISCSITPAHSIITEGQALQLQALCTGGSLNAVNWKMDGESVTGEVSLTDHAANEILYFTTPVGLGGNNRFLFTVTGTPKDVTDPVTNITSTTATVVVKPSSAVVARAAAGSATPTTPVDAVCGSAAIAGLAVQRMPTGSDQCDLATGKPALAITGPTSFSWSCISLTHGAETSCYVPRGIVYTVTASDGGSDNGNVTPTSQSVNGGQPATVTAQPATNYNTVWSGTCGGTPSGNTFTINSVNANCNVNASFVQQQSTYAVTASAGTGGTISPNGSQTVNANATPGFTVTANSGYTVSGVTGCGGALNGSTYTTAPVTASCNVVASFSQVTPPPSSGGDDPGSGFWSPAGTTNRIIASQSGTELYVTTSYVPGCLNGDNAIASSNGCAASPVATNNFAFGSGKVLGLRYMPKAGASTSMGSFAIFSGDGGQVGQSMKVWLSRNAAASYDETPDLCKNTSTMNPIIITGKSERRGVVTNFCPITEGVRYYLLMSVDATATNPASWRYQVDETAATFN